MIRLTVFTNQSVAVFGLGGSGLAAADALRAGGANVIVWDDSEQARESAASAGHNVQDPNTADWSKLSNLVLAPGVPLTHPTPHWTVEKAREAGVDVIGDVELFARQRQASAPNSPFIAITGTNGKSTSTALTAHVLNALGCKVSIGGNIGKAILTLEPPEENRIHVVEMSSYQIDLTPTLKPTVGVLLNITPDHLDRHGTLKHYASVKARLVQGAGAACICVDDPLTKEIAETIEPPERLYAFTKGKGAATVPRAYAIGSSLFVHETKNGIGESQEVVDLKGARALRGAHNIENALAVVTAVRALADQCRKANPDFAEQLWQPQTIRDALLSFPGLAHRLQQIAQLGRVAFVNDSKATNAESAEKALASFPGDIYWIAGGRAKQAGIDSLKALTTRIAKTYLIGEAAAEFAQTLDGHVECEQVGTMEAAVAHAARDAIKSEALSPV
nr:UDP-N-acetylmuramoyl-L-alanine--D-glutamate ligase [Alphaproteobacteria bacterium]